ncbi:hypothetical protein [Lunatibacter salilacus]|uniref:hypothetical protein n=1 Tax=Lunatibacter salilacus TaxID=2483804 RepID=UPI00131B6C90|nr:hypothetical protein [Lunatibacter salilacus]
MKKSNLLFLLLVVVSGATFGQNLESHLSLGTFRIPNQQRVEQPVEGFNLNLGLTYQLGENWTIGTSINHSVNQYHRASAANTPLLSELGSLPLEGKLLTDHFSLVFGRKLRLPWDLVAEFGTGIGMFVEENEFMEVVNFDRDRKVFTGFFRKTATTVDIHLPIVYSIKKVFHEKATLGLQGGLFIDSSGYSRGIFFGPRISFFL